MTTATRKNTATATLQFEILDEAPKFRSAPGREKSPLRRAMEQLQPGQSMNTGETVSGDVPSTNDDKAVLSSIRQKATEISKAEGIKGMFSVRVDIENRVIVTRNEVTDTE